MICMCFCGLDPPVLVLSLSRTVYLPTYLPPVSSYLHDATTSHPMGAIWYVEVGK